MGNFKVRVNSEAESKEVMNLLDMTGYTKGAIDNISKPCWIAVLDEKQYSDYMLSKSTWYTANPKEITLPELRAMVNPSLKDQYLEQGKKINDACASVFKKQDDLLTAMLNHSSVSINDQYAEIEQVRQASKDNVSNPSHYTQGKVECIDALESATIGKSGIEAVCVANVIKYLWRYEEKNGLEDVKKAQWYLERLVASMGS